MSNLFPKIGEVADQTDKIENKDETTTEDAVTFDKNEERVVQEVESLCMKCNEQVWISVFVVTIVVNSSAQ